MAARLLPAPLRLDLPAQPQRLAELRRAVEDWAVDAALDTPTVDDLQLALGEAVANAVEHAYREAPVAGRVRVRLGVDGEGTISAGIEDDGTWRTPPGDRGFRGRGLEIARNLTTAFDLEHGTTGTTIRFDLRRPDAGVRPATWQHRPRASRPAELIVSATADGRCLQLDGDLDLDGVAGIRGAALAALDDGDGPVTLDLGGLGHLASAGMGLLLELVQQARRAGAPLTVLPPRGGPARRVLELTGLGQVLAARDYEVAAAQQLLERRRAAERALERVGRGRRRAAGDQVGELAGRAVDALGQPAAGAVPAGPVLGRGEDRRRGDDGPQVGEQRAHRVLEHQRVPRRAGGRAEERRLAGQRVLVEHVEERLEQAAVGRGEDRRDRDQRVGADDRVDRRLQRLVGEPGQQVVGEVAGVLAQLDDLDGDVDAALAQGGDGGRGQPVGQQPRRRRGGQAGADDGEGARCSSGLHLGGLVAGLAGHVVGGGVHGGVAGAAGRGDQRGVGRARPGRAPA